MENYLNKQVLQLQTEQIQKYINKREEKESEIAAVYDTNGVDTGVPERGASADSTFDFIDQSLVQA